MVAATATLGHDSQQPSPFMRLPPEIRVMIYDFAIHKYLEEIERTDFRRTFDRSGLETRTEARLERVGDLEYGNAELAAPYLGALAFLHVSKIVYLESYHVIEDALLHHVLVQAFRQDSNDKARRQAKLSGQRAIADYYSRTKSRMIACSRVVDMVESSVDNTWRSGRLWDTSSSDVDHAINDMFGKHQAALSEDTKSPSCLEDDSPKCQNDRSGVGGSPAVKTAVHDEPANLETGAHRDARLMADVEAEFPSIYAGVQRRLEDGAGVRISFKAEISSSLGVEISNDGVTAMIKGIAVIGASLKTIRNPDCSSQQRSFRVVKHKSMSKQAQSAKRRALPVGIGTLPSADEMDTGP